MGEAESIKKTQDELGKFVKKPPLTDKNLSRPPFRFLHDIVKNVIETTGFMEGVFSPDELDAATITSREAKTAFMQKLIGAIKEKTGDDVQIKVSKVLAGLEADKTNGLLQALARSIEIHQKDNGNTAAAASSTSKKAATTKKAPAKAGAKPTGAAAKKPGNKLAAASIERRDSGGGGSGSGGTKRTVRDPSPATKVAAKQGKTSDAASKSKSTRLKGAGKENQSQIVAAEANIPESYVNDETNVNERPEVSQRPSPPSKNQPSSLGRKESSGDLLGKSRGGGGGETVPMILPEEVDDLDNTGEEGTTTTTATVAAGPVANNNSASPSIRENDLEIYDNFAASVVKPNMQTLPPPKTPLMTDADAVNATMMEMGNVASPTTNKSSLSLSPSPSTLGRMPTPSSPIVGRSGSGRPPTGAGSRSLSREASAEQKGSPFGSASIGEVRPPTGQQRSRPDTGTAAGRMSSARPPSARRAPPRPKSSVVREDPEPYRPTTGKVAHVIMDNTEDPDDENYIVREVTINTSKPPGLSDLDETPELNLGGMGGGGGLSGLGMGGSLLGDVGADLGDELLSPDQRGLLVNQILETQKELEDKKGEDTPAIDKKLKELSLAEVEKLKNLIQICARSANPLARLLDYMAEDVDSMQKEHNNYKEESKRLSLELENAKSETEVFLQNLKHDLSEIERKIKDKQDAILASQMKIIQQEERIEEIVSGFERVRSGKSASAAQDHMPPADEILAHIQGQSGGNSTSAMSGGGFGGMRGPSIPSVFSVSSSAGGGGRIGSSTPSSATSFIGGAPPGLQTQSSQESFKIPDSFMANGEGNSNTGFGSATGSSPFSRGRMWANMNNNNGNSTFDMNRGSMEEDTIYTDDQPLSSFTRRSMGRSGAGAGVGGGGMGAGGFRRTASGISNQLDQDETMMDVENFNPWK